MMTILIMRRDDSKQIQNLHFCVPTTWVLVIIYLTHLARYQITIGLKSIEIQFSIQRRKVCSLY